MSRYEANLFSTAPMLDWTDRHCRYFWRLLTKKTLLYTEMVTAGAVLFSTRDYLEYNEGENPVALQLGGSVPGDLAKCAAKAQHYGYNEINLNVGCPSDRVQNGGFGASLMANADLVADCFQAMADVSSVPVTVKCRIGIDNLDSYEFLCNFISRVEAAGCDHFIIHARKAWLSGLSPRENRDIPPLDYPRVYQIKKDFPHLFISINGGITGLDEVREHLKHTDGVMLGRAVYQNPFLLSRIDREIFGDETSPEITRDEVMEKLIIYAEQLLKQGGRLSYLTRHILDLYTGLPGARTFRRILSQEAIRPGAGTEVLRKAWNSVQDAGIRQQETEEQWIRNSGKDADR